MNEKDRWLLQEIERRRMLGIRPLTAAEEAEIYENWFLKSQKNGPINTPINQPKIPNKFTINSPEIPGVN